MNYLELINRYWQEVDLKGWTPVETNIYFRLLDFCNKTGWRNPFALPNPRAVALMAVTENTLAAGRDKLVMKGLIGFKKGSRRSEAPMYCFPEKVNGEWVFPESFTSNIAPKPVPKQGTKPVPKQGPYNKTKTKTETIPPINISPSRAHEDREIERFDSFMQEFYDGKHQLWEDQTRMKLRIGSVRDYLSYYRNYAIVNSIIGRITTIDYFKQYFVWKFSEFNEPSPMELLDCYEANSKTDEFSRYCKWIAEKAPNVAMRLKPLTEEELSKLVEVYGSELVFKTILDLNNRKDLIPKYYSLFRTLKNWLQNEQPITK